MKTMIYIHALILLIAISIRTNHKPVIENNTSTTLSSKIFNVIDPCDLISFEAVQKSDKVELFWDIKSTSQHAYFTVERSKNGVNFEKIATIDAGGNTNNVIQYIETDNRPLKGKAYYRLKLTDIKNKSTYSNIIMVNEKNIISSSKPANKTNLTTEFKKLGKTPVLVILRDANGKEHFSKVQVKAENSEIIGTDNEHRLTPGTYTIKGTSYNALYSHKLIVR